MRQLDLFEDWLSQRGAVDLDSDASSEPQADQLQLFADPALRLARARRALQHLDLEVARDELSCLLRRFPSDPQARTSLELVEGLRRRLRKHQARGADELGALLALEPALPEELRTSWHRRVAREAETLRGEGCLLADVPVGLHWLRAGELEEAVRSLRATLARLPGETRTRGYLADALHLLGDRERSRREYARAFGEQPRAVDLGQLADPEVLDLLQAARYEYEMEEDAESWVAAIGIVRGVFAVPDLLLPGLSESTNRASDEPGLHFLDALLEERRARSLDERVTARRRMKQLCPLLLAEYLHRTPP